MKEKTRNTSARKKLVPAVAMLTTSAIMLSSATYAWFTLNKEVEVTGLQMEAVAGDALEISLGAFSDNKYNPSTAPTKEDSGWKRSIDWSEAYSGFGALKPASSDSATQLMAVDENGVIAGGMQVIGDTTVSKVDGGTNYPAAEILLSGGTPTGGASAGLTEGYYIDVPMWIRTNKTVESGKVDIDCTVTITKGANGKADDELMNAVRVAILPVKTGTSAADYATVPNVVSGAVTVETGQNEKVFGLNNATYNDKVLDSNDTTGEYSTAITGTPTVYKAANSLYDNDLDRTNDGYNDANVTPKTVAFSLDSAEQNDYSGCAFIVRIWLEGESYFCKDANANQDWRVDLHFDLCDGLTTESGTHSHGTMASTEKIAVKDETPTEPEVNSAD